MQLDFKAFRGNDMWLVHYSSASGNPNMPITIKCPSCARSLSVKDTLAGREASCPKCHHRLSVPMPLSDDQYLQESNESNSHAARFQTNQPHKTVWLPYIAIVVLAGILFAENVWLLTKSSSENKVAKTTEKTAENEKPLETDKDLKSAVNSPTASPVLAATSPPSVDTPVKVDASKVAKALKEDEEKRSEADKLRTEQATKLMAEQRITPKTILFKDFANFPEEYMGCVRFENVWLHGDFERVQGTKDFSPGVSSEDGKRISGRKTLEFVRGAAFVISEEIGRPLSVKFESDSKYKVNLNCEITKKDKAYIVRIYRVETINLAGSVKDVYEEK